MASANRHETLMIELDVLLDTRLGTIALHWGEEVALEVLETGYHQRVCDSYPKVDKDAFQAQYRNRNVDTLKASRVTNAVSLVKELTALLAEQAISAPYHDGVKIVVNVFPYKLTDEERDEISKALVVWLGTAAPIELAFMPPEVLTPSYCKQNYSLVMIYEYEQWLNIHTAGFKLAQLPEVLVLAPAIYFAGPAPATEELESLIREAAHPFKATQMLLAPLIGLQLIDVLHFSVLSKPDSKPAYSPTPATPPVQTGGAAEEGVHTLDDL